MTTKYVIVRVFDGSGYLGSISVSPQGRRSIALDGDFSVYELRAARELIRYCFRPGVGHCGGQSFHGSRGKRSINCVFDPGLTV
jgi:hypothetical protein